MNRILYLILSFLILNCYGEPVNHYDDLNYKFDEAKLSFEKEKYSKAKEQFQFIILNNPGSIIATKAQYYLAESYYHLENYNQASREYDKFTMISQNSELVAKSKFLTCKCLYLLSSDSNKDQNDTQFTINRIQMFLEEYPNTGHKSECELMIGNLREKLAKKDIDSGKLYLRMEKYQSALIYFNLVLSEYWDTIYTDEALYNIIISYLLNNDIDMAQLFLDDNKDKFKDDSYLSKSNNIIINAKEGSRMKIFFELVK